ncbi:MAG: hypothetical protein JW725_00815 [Candidatus Babeliaceae bacterium]|nr:hypothetical protein [Candidatus Babeliaceae bacterium]
METEIAVFKGKEIRKTIHNDEWWFSVADVVEALTDTVNSSFYIKKMRKRGNELSKGWEQIVTPLSLKAEGGRVNDL